MKEMYRYSQRVKKDCRVGMSCMRLAVVWFRIHSFVRQSYHRTVWYLVGGN